MNTQFQTLIIDKFLSVLGLSIVKEYIYDDDKMAFLIYNEGKIKTSRNGIFHNNDTEFNPLFDIKQMEYFFTAYTNKEAEEDGLYIQSMGINNSFVTTTGNGPTPIKYQLHIDTNERPINTNYYYNMCLCYIEAVFRLANIFEWDSNLQYWLRETDYTEQDMMIRLEKSNKGR